MRWAGFPLGRKDGVLGHWTARLGGTLLADRRDKELLCPSVHSAW